MSTQSHGRAFVLGFDGVPWDLVVRWSDAGELPNFARLFAEGAAGPLESTKPANTPVAWPAIATGTWPDRHGVYEFVKLGADYTQRPYSRNDIREPVLWEQLTPAVVGNVPLTYPPAEIDGALVTGMLTPSASARFAHPKSLEAQIRRELPDYQFELKWHEYGDRTEAFLADLERLVANRRKLMELLMEREDWRLFFFVYVAPDRLQHLVWDDDVLLNHYRTLDDILGEVMAYVEAREATLFVVSDHGFGPVSRVVSVNRLLVETGYLVPRSQTGVRGALSKLGLDKTRVLAALSRVGITDRLLVQYLPPGVLKSAAARIPGDHQLYDVDHRRTTAFLHGLGSVYVNDTARFTPGAVSPSDRPRIKAELAALLAALTDPETGAPVLSVFDGATLNPRDPNGPDLVITAREGYHVDPSLGPEVVGDVTGVAAYHRPDGIFFAWGPDVAAGVAPTEAWVVDVAPTVLHAAGEPIAKDSDGRVLTEIFAPDSETARREIKSRAYRRTQSAGIVEEDYSAVEDRLRGLGYLE
ncbi:alkaline phosphatase family protein [Haladaptatus sp. GCM10025707]|uniref:alkaline phosphatase family protein n=1 Tax=unclassified Haladaptatus TaxID=2622732 RepID=UPI0023E76174|nr:MULTISPECIES: alkaline phosphatase family protein [unclassified Haladaptatus]